MIYFTSDTHFGDQKLVEHTRMEFASIEEHDSHLIGSINNKVGRNDILVILGDFCKEKPGLYRPLIKCRHTFFILGNHDKEQKIRNVFGGNVWQQKMVKLNTGEKVWCSHYPTAFWDGSHNGTYHAYGHIHDSTSRNGMMNVGMPGRRSMDVGMDAADRLLGNWEPFSETEFLYFLERRIGHDLLKRSP
jgi:calcineurin-like phosphoesterase family protein